MRRLRKCPFCGSGRDWLRMVRNRKDAKHVT